MLTILKQHTLLIIALIYVLLSTHPSSAQKPVQDTILRAGAAISKITPPVGSIMGNSYGLTICEGVHDDLYARTIVLDHSGTKAVFIALDLISIPYVIVMETRKLIAQQTGIPATSIVMTATHVHAGPQLNPMFIDAVGGLPKQKSAEYLRKLPEMIAGSVLLAGERLQPVRVSVSTVKENDINFNRRFLMKDGSFKMNPGRLNKNAVRAVGPVDPDVNVVYFESLDSRPVAILVNFALHPAIIGGNNISADFPGIVCDLLAKVKGEEMVTVYTNGTSGNINHIDFTRLNQLDGYSESTRIGTIIAADVMKALSSLHPVEIKFLRIRSEKVELPVPEVLPAEVKWAHDVIARNGKPKPPPFNDVVRAWKILDQSGIKSTTTVPLNDAGNALISEVQALVLGNELALIGFPGDAFVELGLAIKQNSPYLFTIVSEQSGNGTLSYVPNRKAVLEGGYEGESARFTPGGGEMLVDAVIRILTEMFPYK